MRLIHTVCRTLSVRRLSVTQEINQYLRLRIFHYPADRCQHQINRIIYYVLQVCQQKYAVKTIRIRALLLNALLLNEKRTMKRTEARPCLPRIFPIIPYCLLIALIRRLLAQKAARSFQQALLLFFTYSSFFFAV